MQASQDQIIFKNFNIDDNQFKHNIFEKPDQLNQQLLKTQGIPVSLLNSTKIDIEHLICYLCKGILWRSLTCNQPNCFTNYCEICLNQYNQDKIKSNQLSNEKNRNKQICPKCLKIMEKTRLPLITNLLSNIKLKCPNFQNGCSQIIDYELFQKHILNCYYQKLLCSGCQKQYFLKDLSKHIAQCSYVEVKCEKCQFSKPQIQFKEQHSQWRCLEEQLRIKSEKLVQVQDEVQRLQLRLNRYENLMEKILKGQLLALNIDFHTSFPANFKIVSQTKHISLLKASFNNTKQKFDFLHFYLTPTIKTSSPLGFQWKIKIQRLKGNLLIGICSSLSSNSIDYVINKYGEIKKKELDQNKYRLVRKSPINFSENDVILFQYFPMNKTLGIFNETKKSDCNLTPEEINHLGQQIYSFYSLDTLDDCLKFF